ncbi:MAG: LacI family transcriptional regulator [Lachnospiraceae bacterium]|nr:LacI family transcriptional regulator [Lachnospiraceae bacterium]
MNKATMMDIARESGYSIATVSRVLNKSGNYSPEAEKKILEIAEAKQYTPDLSAQELRLQHGKSIGVIIPSMEIAYYGFLGQMIQRELLLQDYYPVFLSLGSKELTNERIFSIIRSLHISGLVCISCVFDFPDLQELNIPAVYVNRTFTGVEMKHTMHYSCVKPDYRQAGYLAAEELSKKGCRKVAFLSGVQKGNLQEKKQSFIEFSRYFGMEYIELKEMEVEDLMQSGYSKARAGYEEHPEIDGYYCDTDITAVGALTYFREKGISVPEDIQLVGYGSVNPDLRYFYDITHIRIPSGAIAHEAAEMIIGMTEGKNEHPREITLQMDLVQGKTTKP